MMRLARYLIVAAVLLGPAGSFRAFAAPVLAAATRTTLFSSTSTASTTVPLRNNNTTTLNFQTTADNQTVVIIYNAECVVDAERGTRLNIKILVDGNQADPSVGADFAFCSAVDTSGATWVSAVRQSVMKVPVAGMHIVTIVGRMFGGAGTWRLDDSSLVVQRAVPSVATREDIFESTATASDPTVFLPLKDSGATVLNVSTSRPDERLKVTYNAECVVAAAGGARIVAVQIFMPDAAVVDGTNDGLCGAVDTAGQTWAGAARQTAVTIPNTGSHDIEVTGHLNDGPGTWRLNDSALVVTRGFLASGAHEVGVSSSSTAEMGVPITASGGKELTFTTTDPDQVVKLTFNALCAVTAARGRWLGIRITVDDIEAQPAAGYNFALCSSVEPFLAHFASGYRQSVITVPDPGTHKVRVFAKMSSAASWGLFQISLVVE